MTKERDEARPDVLHHTVGRRSGEDRWNLLTYLPADPDDPGRRVDADRLDPT